MKYLLRHKNIDVAELELETGGFVVKALDVLDEAHYPYGVDMDGKALRLWWTQRIVPASRDGISACLREHGIQGVHELALESLGLNLSDQYWVISKEKQKLAWEDVNFFDNDFFEEKERLRFGPRIGGGIKELSLPDRSTGGQRPKRWTIENGGRYLIKAGVEPVFMEAYNEKIGSLIGKLLGINSVKYEVVTENGFPASKCACFVDRNTELIHAADIILPSGPEGHYGKNAYEHCVKSFSDACVPDARRKIDEMIVFDFLITNVDRHAFNFGMIRDANTLTPISFAPLYDHERSMWHIYSGQNCHTFCETHEEQIMLVDDFSWYDPRALNSASDEICNIIEANNYRNIEQSKKEIRAFEERVKRLNRIAYSTHIAGRTPLKS